MYLSPIATLYVFNGMYYFANNSKPTYMRNVLLVMMLFIGAHAFAQEGIESAKIFVRVYNLNGYKIGKGKILSFSDEAIEVSKGKAVMNILLSDIGSIKTKHSGGHNVLIGAAVGAATGIILSLAATDDSDVDDVIVESTFATAGGLILGATGAAVGGISVLFKKVETFSIDADPEKFKAFQNEMGSRE